MKNKDRENAVSYLLLVLVLGLIMTLTTGCQVHFGIDWNGETGVSKTTISKDFVEGKKPITDRRY